MAYIEKEVWLVEVNLGSNVSTESKENFLPVDTVRETVQSFSQVGGQGWFKCCINQLKSCVSNNY